MMHKKKKYHYLDTRASAPMLAWFCLYLDDHITMICITCTRISHQRTRKILQVARCQTVFLRDS